MRRLKIVQTMEFREIKLNPVQQAFHHYGFMHAEQAEGLNYQVSAELVNRNLEALGSEKRVDDSLPIDDYLELMWPLLNEARRIEI